MQTNIDELSRRRSPDFDLSIAAPLPTCPHCKKETKLTSVLYQAGGQVITYCCIICAWQQQRSSEALQG